MYPIIMYSQSIFFKIMALLWEMGDFEKEIILDYCRLQEEDVGHLNREYKKKLIVVNF